MKTSATGIFLGSFFAGASFFLGGHGLLLEQAPILAFHRRVLIFPINITGIAGSLMVLMN